MTRRDLEETKTMAVEISSDSNPCSTEVMSSFGLFYSSGLLGERAASQHSCSRLGEKSSRHSKGYSVSSGETASSPAVDILSSLEAFEQWLMSLVRCYAFTDIYFSPDEVRLGVDGQVHPLNPPLAWNDSAGRRLLRWLEKGAGQAEGQSSLRRLLDRYGSADTSWTCGNLRFRVNIFCTRQQLGFVFRRIPEAISNFNQLLLPGEVMARLAVSMENGLFLVGGRAGSGKSATLSAFVQFWNQHRYQHILIIEDPMEYFYQSQCSLIHQREVSVDVPSFSDALRGALRQSPHIIVVGEIRDEETARMALQAAETGHLVAATIHAGGALGALRRFAGLFPESEQRRVWGRLVSAFNVVLGQLLLPLRSTEKQPGALHKSRIPAIEILRSTYHVRQLLASHQGGDDAIYKAMEQGRDEYMITLDEYLYLLVKAGSITPGTALGVAHSPNNLRLRLQNL